MYSKEQKNNLKYSLAVSIQKLPQNYLYTSNHIFQGDFIEMYKYIITKLKLKERWYAYMTETLKTTDTLMKNREQFKTELKMFINQKLFDKKLISEDMYWTAKELLLKQAG